MNILCYCFLCASCWKSSYNYILVILPNDKSLIWHVLKVKLKKSRTFQAKYFHNTEESLMAAMINKSVVRVISRACATHETAPLTAVKRRSMCNALVPCHREATTGNASALHRLPNRMQIYFHIKHDKRYVRMTTHFFSPRRLFGFFLFCLSSAITTSSSQPLEKRGTVKGFTSQI